MSNSIKTIYPPSKTPWKCNFCPKKKDRDNNNTYSSNVTKRSYRGPMKYTCQSRNLVYLTTCKKCGKQYVGETYRTFEVRMKEHTRYIKLKDLTQSTGRHFNLAGHTSLDFHCHVIHLLHGTPIRKDDKRTEKEELFIDQLKTREPLSLNDKGRKRIVHY